MIDGTGIQGRFDIHLDMGSVPVNDSSESPGEAMVFSSGDGAAKMKFILSDFQRRNQDRVINALPRVGLRIQASKGPGEYLVIDRIEKPSVN